MFFKRTLAQANEIVMQDVAFAAKDALIAALTRELELSQEREALLREDLRTVLGLKARITAAVSSTNDTVAPPSGGGAQQILLRTSPRAKVAAEQDRLHLEAEEERQNAIRTAIAEYERTGVV